MLVLVTMQRQWPPIWAPAALDSCGKSEIIQDRRRPKRPDRRPDRKGSFGNALSDKRPFPLVEGSDGFAPPHSVIRDPSLNSRNRTRLNRSSSTLLGDGGNRAYSITTIVTIFDPPTNVHVTAATHDVRRFENALSGLHLLAGIRGDERRAHGPGVGHIR